MADRATRRFRIYQDEVKLRHTSHWDMDTMSRSELDAYMTGNQQHADPSNEAGPTHIPDPPAESAWSRFLRAILPAR
ncbi:hypothetical protein [Azoarcus taiwanensis]|uniref:Uncharacterized protein n=1 Tax=Azoarcus taiwanensis TaxID=666964 RepID=A0A972FLN8_9RHOO|nr:hypothetical protein [Azoarcus taiwanensis]NMG04561.1 hypothetical protein [Azoarcus taiwanensis]